MNLLDTHDEHEDVTALLTAATPPTSAYVDTDALLLEARRQRRRQTTTQLALAGVGATAAVALGVSAAAGVLGGPTAVEPPAGTSTSLGEPTSSSSPTPAGTAGSGSVTLTLPGTASSSGDVTEGGDLEITYDEESSSEAVLEVVSELTTESTRIDPQAIRSGDIAMVPVSDRLTVVVTREQVGGAHLVESETSVPDSADDLGGVTTADAVIGQTGLRAFAFEPATPWETGDLVGAYAYDPVTRQVVMARPRTETAAPDQGLVPGTELAVFSAPELDIFGMVSRDSAASTWHSLAEADGRPPLLAMGTDTEVEAAGLFPDGATPTQARASWPTKEGEPVEVDAQVFQLGPDGPLAWYATAPLQGKDWEGSPGAGWLRVTWTDEDGETQEMEAR